MSGAAVDPSVGRRYGAQSMSAPLREVLVVRPGRTFGTAFDDPAHGFLHPVDLAVARREHARFVEVLASLGPTVHELDGDALCASPDGVYAFDPLLVTDRGAIPLRPGKANRRVEPAALEVWTRAAGIPTAGRIEAPGTVEGGDTFWLRPDLFCVGRTLRTNEAGARQLATLVGGDVRILDLPFWRGPAELIHLMSVISPVADDLAVVFLPLLPAGLWELLNELRIRLVEVPEEEFPTLGCNVLATAPGVVILAEGNPRTAAALAAAGCEVHTYPATEIGMNGSGGPTCMTRPILRD
jgi:dimethylargininase